MTTINTLDDFLQALDANPSWREAVRSQILGEEILQLPVRFSTFASEADTVLYLIDPVMDVLGYPSICYVREN